MDGANLIATAGDWMCSVPSEESDRDPYDVALYRFPPEAVEKLRGMRFLRIGDTSFDDPGPTAIYSLFGFPGLWSEPTHTPHERLTVKALAAGMRRLVS